jgi:hypothetical protein
MSLKIHQVQVLEGAHALEEDKKKKKQKKKIKKEREGETEELKYRRSKMR